MSLDLLMGVVSAATGLSKNEILEAAINPEKQDDALLKVSQHAAESMGRGEIAARVDRIRKQRARECAAQG